MPRNLDAVTQPPPEAPTVVVEWRTRQAVTILIVTGVVLAGLTLVASQTGPSAIDLDATLWLQRVNLPGFDALMYAVSWPGFAPQTWLMPVVVAGVFAVRGLRMEALWILGTHVSTLVTIVLKEVVHRPRPSPELVHVAAPLTDLSFPSGHVVQYATLFGFTVFLVYVLARPSLQRTILLVLLALPIVLVGPSRLYLGQHWLSDVVGGYAVSTLVLLPYCWAYIRWLRRHRQSPQKG
jgi:membrane-associated phospholipid phosphatase